MWQVLVDDWSKKDAISVAKCFISSKDHYMRMTIFRGIFNKNFYHWKYWAMHHEEEKSWINNIDSFDGFQMQHWMSCILEMLEKINHVQRMWAARKLGKHTLGCIVAWALGYILAWALDGTLVLAHSGSSVLGPTKKQNNKCVSS